MENKISYRGRCINHQDIAIIKKIIAKYSDSKCTPPNPLANRKKPIKVDIEETPLECSLKDLFPNRLEQVSRTDLEKIFKKLYHHPLYSVETFVDTQFKKELSLTSPYPLCSRERPC